MKILYRDVVKIDKIQFDEEVLRFSSDFRDAYKAEMDAIDERDRAKASWVLREKRKELEIRSKKIETINEEYGLQLTSLTESAIKALTLQDKEVYQAQQEYFDAKKKVADCNVVRESLERKFKMMDTYSYLKNRDEYYSSKDYFKEKSKKWVRPTITGDMKKKVEEKYGK